MVWFVLLVFGPLFLLFFSLRSARASKRERRRCLRLVVVQENAHGCCSLATWEKGADFNMWLTPIEYPSIAHYTQDNPYLTNQSDHQPEKPLYQPRPHFPSQPTTTDPCPDFRSIPANPRIAPGGTDSPSDTVRPADGHEGFASDDGAVPAAGPVCPEGRRV